MKLLGTNCTGQLFLWVIRWAGHSIAVSFNMEEYCRISTSSTSWYWVWVLINTLVHGTIVVVVKYCCWHEVARVLQSPSRWTAGFSWDHHDCHPRWSIAHSTGSIVVMKSWEWSRSTVTCLVLHSIHIAVTLNSRLIAEVVWIIRHAEVVGCSSPMRVIRSTSPPCIHQLSSWDIWTASFPPPCVDYSTTPWASRTLRAGYSSHPSLSLWPTGTRHPISSIPSISPSQYLNVGKGTIVETAHSVPCGCTPLWPVQSSSWKEWSQIGGMMFQAKYTIHIVLVFPMPTSHSTNFQIG